MTPVFKSKFESDVFFDAVRRKISVEYEPERLRYAVSEKRTYTPDFAIRTKSGKKIFVETKGRFVAADRKKMLLVLAQHPELDIRILFQSDNRLSKRSKTTYGEWCDRNGIEWAVGRSIPVEWMR